MDYKKIVKSRAVRTKILRMLSFIPDKTMLKLQYRIKFGRALNLKEPKRYTEKIQWYKLFYKNPLMIRCVDKYDVREYIDNLGYGKLLTTCYGVFEKVEDIDFEKLPNKFVLKDTLAGGGTSVILVRDKSELDLGAVRQTMQSWLSRPVAKGGGREWPYYSGKKHRIIIEELLESEDEKGLSDLKFLCFDGRVECVQYLTNRKLGESFLEEGILDRDFRVLPVFGVEHAHLEQDLIAKPAEFEEMIGVAEALGKGFPHVRVDLYDLEGRIVFGELTFFPASGYKKYSDDKYDFELGSKFVLPKEWRKE